jgi:hypothetical protein
VETSSGHRLTATWSGLERPVIVEAPGGVFGPKTDLFSLLFFASEASIQLNGAKISGGPYVRDIWRKSIGGDRSSCVFALSETFTRSAR